MGSSYVWLLQLTFLAVAFGVPASTRADEPPAKELIALAPVLDSADRGCRNLDVGGWFGSDLTLSPKLRFRAIYRAPNQFSLLISDVVDGTPLVFCSGKKMFFYDPIVPTVYYSEEATFTLDLAPKNGDLKLNLNWQLRDKSGPRIFVDLHSVMELGARAAATAGFTDAVVKRGPDRFEFIWKYQGKSFLIANIDLSKACPYTWAAFLYDDVTVLCLDRLILNDNPGDEPFAFPGKQLLMQSLPVKDVTADQNVAEIPSVNAALGRAAVARAVVGRAGPPGPIDIPGFSGVNWDRVRENDKKYGPVIRGFVSPTMSTNGDVRSLRRKEPAEGTRHPFFGRAG